MSANRQSPIANNQSPIAKHQSPTLSYKTPHFITEQRSPSKNRTKQPKNSPSKRRHSLVSTQEDGPILGLATGRAEDWGDLEIGTPSWLPVSYHNRENADSGGVGSSKSRLFSEDRHRGGGGGGKWWEREDNDILKSRYYHHHTVTLQP